MEFNDLCGCVHFEVNETVLLSATLKGIQEKSQSIYIPRGINTEALDRSLKWDFNPSSIKVR